MDSQSVCLECISEEEVECELSEIVEESYLLTEKPDLKQKLDELKGLISDLRRVVACQTATLDELGYSYYEILFMLLDQVLKVDDLQTVLPIFSYLEESSPLESILESNIGDEDLTAVSDEISSEQAANYVKYMKGKLQVAKDMVWKNLTKNERRPTVDVNEISEQPVDGAFGLVQHLQENLQSVHDEMKKRGINRQKVLQMAVKAECVASLFHTRLERLGSSRSSKRKRRGDERCRRRN